VNPTVKILRETKHFKTEVDPNKLGMSAAEVVLVGRSNVGKSSLINAICQHKNLAYSSQVPGKTRTINVYEVIPGRWIVDLPGYGFAVGLKNEKDTLGKIIEGYLFGREAICMVFVVIDAVAGPTKLDMMMIGWLRHHSFPYSFIVSKIDKISTPKIEARKIEIAEELQTDAAEISWISSSKGIGLPELQSKIGQLLL
jgi:GTP-binding protein